MCSYITSAIIFLMDSGKYGLGRRTGLKTLEAMYCRRMKCQSVFYHYILTSGLVLTVTEKAVIGLILPQIFTTIQ